MGVPASPVTRNTREMHPHGIMMFNGCVQTDVHLELKRG